MTDSTFRAQLKTVLDSVSTVKNTNNYVRYFNELDDYKKVFKTGDDKIHCWMIGLTAVNIRRPSIIPGGLSAEVFEDYEYMVTGYYGLDDSATSETVFALIWEAVKDALNSDATLHTNSATYWDTPPCQVQVEHVVFGGVLCHRATITQVITKKVNT